MKFKYLIILIAGLAINKETYAQNYAVDALRFSQYEFGSTARIKALGNSQTAVGGDLSSIGGNPAGIGLFTKSELSLTTEIMRYSTESNYFNQNTDANRGRVNINNLGAVFFVRLAKPSGSDANSGAISLNFGLGYNKTNDFGNKIAFSGTNQQNSIADFYADLANSYDGTLINGSLEDAAEKSNLIILENNKYISATNANRSQNEVIIRNGSQSEFNLAAGLNISNKFYLGTSIGILGIKYSSDNTFTEKGTLSYTENGGYSEDYNNNYYQRFEAKGSGFNIKLGAIFRPNQYIRIGATAQTPNYYTIDDTYSESNTTYLTNNPFFEDQRTTSETSYYDFTYALKTPAKYSLGIALFQNSIGFITGDLEFADYSSIELKNNDTGSSEEFVEDNRFMVNNYKSVVNYKVGAEIKALPPVLLRLGYSHAGSPLENSDQDLDIQTYTFGAGYRFNNMNLDIAYQTSSVNSQTSPYVLNNGMNPIATSASTRNGIFLTIGTRF